MRIAFVHHHFRQGGVTRVISQQASSLSARASTILITGEPPPHSISIPYTVVPSIAYDRDRSDHLRPSDIAREVIDAVSTHWKGGADLYHFHNPTLGKNVDFLAAIKVMISMNQKVLLQIHDFAEDGRPWGYTREDYPSDCHYAVINHRDYGLLLEAGLKPQGLHYIPNSIRLLEIAASNKVSQDIVLYPIRAIRRKNIGEAILHSLFLKDDLKIGISLEPTGMIDVRSYRDWMDFVKHQDFRVLFRLGIEHDFAYILMRTRCMITTSIKEGFGLSFLEPWTGGKMLYGRLLADVCSDFIEKGIRLDHLYRDIKVPLAYIDEWLFHRKWVNCYRERLVQYGITESSEEIEEHFRSIIKNGYVDFGLLSEDLQRQVILGLSNNEKRRKKFLDLNTGLADTNFFKDSREVIESNRRIVESEYSEEKNRELLLTVYEKVLSSDVTQSIDKKVLLFAFNTPEKNTLLLCESAYT